MKHLFSLWLILSFRFFCFSQRCKSDGIIGNSQRLVTANDLENFEKCLEREKGEITMCTSDILPVCLSHIFNPVCQLTVISASEDMADMKGDVPNAIMRARLRLPEELCIGNSPTLLLSNLQLPNTTIPRGSNLASRLVILKVFGEAVSGPQVQVNITLKLLKNITIAQRPECVFLDFSTQEFSSDGCLTLWERGQNNVTCSCNHLTCFGVLLVSSSLSSTDQQVLSYITMIGCSVSLLSLVVVVLLFLTHRKVQEDDSSKIHVNLAFALILLNAHFLPSQAVAGMSSPGLCLYMALSLHYSLLATFSWMALEAFHLYLLLIRVFNIYIKRYLLKLSVVGWGVPAVIVSVVAIIDADTYGRVSLDPSEPNSSTICYITKDLVKTLTTVGVFALVFLFNLSIFGVTVRQFGKSTFDRIKQDICTLLTFFTLLGISWGLIFFSFGHLTTPGLYVFCILNSLQGFFFFLYFVLHLKKIKDAAAQRSNETQNTISHTLQPS